MMQQQLATPSNVVMETSARSRCMSSFCCCDWSLRAPASLYEVHLHRKELMYWKRRGTADKRKHPSVSDYIRFLKFCLICRLSEQTCSCSPWKMHLTRVVLLRASLLLLQEVPGLSTWVTGPANTSLHICHCVTRSDTYISYYIRLVTYVCPQLCLRFMFVFSPLDYSALALSRFHSNLGSMGIIHSISCLCMNRHFSFFKICHESMGWLLLCPEEGYCCRMMTLKCQWSQWGLWVSHSEASAHTALVS